MDKDHPQKDRYSELKPEEKPTGKDLNVKADTDNLVNNRDTGRCA